ncbi:MAG: hypothetical protein KF690_11760, partial [Bacteroidetes bacterium]|nr:hypothetical protein [Bacteroidota bacterium]
METPEQRPCLGRHLQAYAPAPGVAQWQRVHYRLRRRRRQRMAAQCALMGSMCLGFALLFSSTRPHVSSGHLLWSQDQVPVRPEPPVSVKPIAIAVFQAERPVPTVSWEQPLPVAPKKNCEGPPADPVRNLHTEIALL